MDVENPSYGKVKCRQLLGKRSMSGFRSTMNLRRVGKRDRIFCSLSTPLLPTDLPLSLLHPASGSLFYLERCPWLSPYPYTRLLALGLVSASVSWLCSASCRTRSLSAVKADVTATIQSLWPRPSASSSNTNTSEIIHSARLTPGFAV